MKIELRRLTYNARLSEETPAFAEVSTFVDQDDAEAFLVWADRIALDHYGTRDLRALDTSTLQALGLRWATSERAAEVARREAAEAAEEAEEAADA